MARNLHPNRSRRHGVISARLLLPALTIVVSATAISVVVNATDAANSVDSPWLDLLQRTAPPAKTPPQQIVLVNLPTALAGEADPQPGRESTPVTPVTPTTPTTLAAVVGSEEVPLAMAGEEVAALVIDYIMLGSPAGILFTFPLVETEPAAAVEPETADAGEREPAPSSDGLRWVIESTLSHPRVSHAFIGVDEGGRTNLPARVGALLAAQEDAVPPGTAAQATTNPATNQNDTKPSDDPWGVYAIEYPTLRAPAPALLAAADHVHFANIPDPSGRTYTPRIRAAGIEGPSAALQATRFLQPGDADPPPPAPFTLAWYSEPFRTYDAEEIAEAARVLYTGGDPVSPTPDVFAGSVVLLGLASDNASAIAERTVSTPIGRVSPAEVHATATANMIEPLGIATAPPALAIILAAATAFLATGFALLPEKPLVRGVIGAAMIAAPLLVSLIVWVLAPGTLLPIGGSLVAGAVGAILAFALSFPLHRRSR